MTSYFSTATSPSKARGSLDGVIRHQISAGRPPLKAFTKKSLVTPPMIHARRQLDAVLLREQKRRGWLYRVKRIAWALLWRRMYVLGRRWMRRLERLLPDLDGIPPKKALYASLIGGVSFGMVAMSLLQGLAGPQAVADSSVTNPSGAVEATLLEQEIGASPQKYDPDNDIFLQFFSEAEKEEYGAQIRELVTGYPIEDMLPYILDKDRMVAAFLVGIAKKESNWGKRVPVLDGQDCFNYWGYRGIRRLMGTGGHTCFNSRKDAVDTVATRLEKLIQSNKLDTPAKMIIWKCGYSCDGHSRESVRKWISDVDMYFRELQGDDDQEVASSSPQS